MNAENLEVVSGREAAGDADHLSAGLVGDHSSQHGTGRGDASKRALLPAKVFEWFRGEHGADRNQARRFMNGQLSDEQGVDETEHGRISPNAES